MTKNSFAGKNERVETKDYRDAIIFYLKEIHGIRDELFKYTKINEIFSKEQKPYIKKMMCNSEDINLDDYMNFSKILDSEKAHVAILVAETKKQVTLTYLSKALSEYLS